MAPTRTDLVADLKAIWPEGVTGLWYEQMLTALIAHKPDTYALWNEQYFAAVLRSVGIAVSKIHRARGGRPATRHGVHLRALGMTIDGRGPVVYFAERHGFLKIGTTLDLDARVNALNRGDCAIDGMMIAPVTVLATMPGGIEVERAIHQMFGDLRYQGEWFLLEHPLTGFVRAVAAAAAS